MQPFKHSCLALHALVPSTRAPIPPQVQHDLCNAIAPCNLDGAGKLAALTACPPLQNP